MNHSQERAGTTRLPVIVNKADAASLARKGATSRNRKPKLTNSPAGGGNKVSSKYPLKKSSTQTGANTKPGQLLNDDQQSTNREG